MEVLCGGGSCHCGFWVLEVTDDYGRSVCVCVCVCVYVCLPVWICVGGYVSRCSSFYACAYSILYMLVQIVHSLTLSLSLSLPSVGACGAEQLLHGSGLVCAQRSGGHGQAARQAWTSQPGAPEPALGAG